MKIDCAVIGCEAKSIDMFLKASPIVLIPLCKHHRGVVQQMLSQICDSKEPYLTTYEKVGFHFE